MLRWAKFLAGLAVVGALGGFFVAWSGVIHVGASTGHWQITEWLLHWAMRQSVETHSLGIESPPLDDEALVRRGAGHYAGSCASCHGAPGLQRSPVTSGMTPEPPPLVERVPEWRPQELFWIVRHGVKFTGMPAWPSLQREDEIWAMVAFLRRLPALDERTYEDLAYGEAAAKPADTEGLAAQDEQARATTAREAGCVRCHGADGAGGAAFPQLAGQSADYLHATLAAFAAGRRHSGFMRAAAAGLDETTMRSLAEHYAAARPAASNTGNATPGDATRGEAIAREGLPRAGIPPCAGCHGLAEGPRYPHYPRLAGQQAWFLSAQLELFKARARGGTPYAPIMQAVAERLDAQQINDLAAFYAGLVAEGH